MKKTLSTILICILVIGTLGCLLTACNLFRKMHDIEGNWIGYKIDDSSVQLFLEVKHSIANSNLTNLTVRQTENGRVAITENSYSGKLVWKSGYDFKSNDKYIGKDEASLSYDENILYYKNFKFIRSDMNLAQWQNASFTLLPIDNGDIVYKAFYFEGEDRRLLSAEQIKDRFPALQNGVYMGFKYSGSFTFVTDELYFMTFTDGNGINELYKANVLKLVGQYNENRIHSDSFNPFEVSITYDYVEDKLLVDSLEFADIQETDCEISALSYILEIENDRDKYLMFIRTALTEKDVKDIAEGNISEDDEDRWNEIGEKILYFFNELWGNKTE